MANLTPFVSPAEQLVEEIGQLNIEIEKLESAKERRKDKLKEIMAEKGVDTIKATNYEAKFEVRKGGPDFSKKAILEAFGDTVAADLEKTLPKRADTKALVIRAVKKDDPEMPVPPQSSKQKLEDIHKFFSK